MSMTAEELIDRYLEQKSELEPKFYSQLTKGQPPKKDKLKDTAFRPETNEPTDNSWMSASTPPYR